MAPPQVAVTAGLGTPQYDRDLGALVERTGTRVVIVCTPIHTHTPLALTAGACGAHVLLEKPPAPRPVLGRVRAAFRRSGRRFARG